MRRRLRHPRDRLTHQADKLATLIDRLRIGWRLRYQDKHGHLFRWTQQLQMRSPQAQANEIAARIEKARTRLVERLNQDLTQQHHRLAGAEGQLKALSPSATLDRGFAIVQLAGKNTLVRSAKSLRSGDAIVTRFASGTANAEVTSTQSGED